MTDQTPDGDGDVPLPVLTLARETLAGDIRDAILAVVKLDKSALPFPALPEARQKEIVERATRVAESTVERAVRIVAADGRRAMTFTLKAVGRDGDKIKAVLTAPYDRDTWAELGEGGSVQIVLAHDLPYRGERRPAHAHVTPDQPALPLDAAGKGPDTGADTGGNAGGSAGAEAPATAEDAAAAAPPVFSTGADGTLDDASLARLATLVAAQLAAHGGDADKALRAVRLAHKIPSKAIDAARLTATLAEPSGGGEPPPSGLVAEGQYTADAAVRAFRLGAQRCRSGGPREPAVSDTAALRQAELAGWDAAREMGARMSRGRRTKRSDGEGDGDGAGAAA